jgi:hypothetical protein
MQIHEFVSQLQLNIPAFTNLSIHSTLIQQLFYELWKSVVLLKTRSNLRDRLKQIATEVIQNLCELIVSNKLSVEVFEKVFESLTQRLLRSFSIIGGDQIMLQCAVRQKQAEIRAQVKELRIAQTKR